MRKEGGVVEIAYRAFPEHGEEGDEAVEEALSDPRAVEENAGG